MKNVLSTVLPGIYYKSLYRKMFLIVSDKVWWDIYDLLNDSAITFYGGDNFTSNFYGGDNFTSKLLDEDK